MFASGPSGFIIDDHTSIEKVWIPLKSRVGLNSVFKLPWLWRTFSLQNILIADENMHFIH